MKKGKSPTEGLKKTIEYSQAKIKESIQKGSPLKAIDTVKSVLRKIESERKTGLDEKLANEYRARCQLQIATIYQRQARKNPNYLRGYWFVR